VSTDGGQSLTDYTGNTGNTDLTSVFTKSNRPFGWDGEFLRYGPWTPPEKFDEDAGLRRRIGSCSGMPC
jgi:hypothetical protein